MQRIRAIDWLRGLVMILMTVDHAGARLDAAHFKGDSAATWTPGTALPAGEFLTRWVSHLCAPTFVLLAGASLALSTARRQGQPGLTRFLVTRGLLIAALDPLWMGLGFSQYQRFPLQVLYAIGMAMVCVAFLRSLSTPVVVALAVAIQALGEMSSWWRPGAEPWTALWKLLFVGGPVLPRLPCRYPLLPWLSIMLLGLVLGRWLGKPRPRAASVRWLAVGGLALLALFAFLRGIDGYGNWGLHRDSPGVLQWLHVSKYPPSITYVALELGIGLVLLAGLVALDDPERPRRALGPLALLGATAFFYYLLHVHLLAAAQGVLQLDTGSHGLLKTWLGAALTLLVLAGPCAWYRRYKAGHPHGWTRYI